MQKRSSLSLIYSRSTITLTFLSGLLFFLTSSLNAQTGCSATSTCGPGWTCIYATETIMTCYECDDWLMSGAVFEWTVEKCDYDPTTGALCNTTTVVNSTPIVTTFPTLSYSFADVGVFIFKVVVRDPVTNTILASPCVSGPNCQNTEVWVYGLPTPSFSTTPLNCSFDPITQMFSHLVEIDPVYNQSVSSGGTPTVVNVDWGDGSSSQHALTPGQSTTVQHLYTWSIGSSPNYSITVDASRSSPYPRPISCLGFVSATGTYVPEATVPAVNFVIQETSCDEQTICIEGADQYELVEVFDENGQLVFSVTPTTSTCFTFNTSGNFCFQFHDGSSNCPQAINFQVLLSPPTTGALSSPDSYVRPGDFFTLNLINPDNHFVTYEILEHRPSGPYWVLFFFGPASQMNNFLVPDFITQQFTTSMLNSDFEFCFRASVLCDEADLSLQNSDNGTFSNVICLPVCAAPDDTGGGGGDDPGSSLVSNPPSGHQTDELADDRSKFLVYPNPAGGPFTIEWDALTSKEPGLLEIQNLFGQTIWRQELENGHLAGGSFDINLPNVPPGQYALVWTTDEHRVLVSQVVIVP